MLESEKGEEDEESNCDILKQKLENKIVELNGYIEYYNNTIEVIDKKIYTINLESRKMIDFKLNANKTRLKKLKEENSKAIEHAKEEFRKEKLQSETHLEVMKKEMEAALAEQQETINNLRAKKS